MHAIDRIERLLQQAQKGFVGEFGGLQRCASAG